MTTQTAQPFMDATNTLPQTADSVIKDLKFPFGPRTNMSLGFIRERAMEARAKAQTMGDVETLWRTSVLVQSIDDALEGSRKCHS